MVSFEVDQKFADGTDKQANSSQMGHVGKDVNRIQALLGRINLKEFRQRTGDIFKERLFQAQSANDIPHGSESAGRYWQLTGSNYAKVEIDPQFPTSINTHSRVRGNHA